MRRRMQDKAKDGTLTSNGDAGAAPAVPSAPGGQRPTPRKRGRWDVQADDTPKPKKTAVEDASAVRRVEGPMETLPSPPGGGVDDAVGRASEIMACFQKRRVIIC